MNRFMMNGRPRLLLIYSDSAHASRCGRYFRRLGWEVRLVSSGSEAQKQLAEFRPDYAVVDVDLPDESGWLTCAKMMLMPGAPQVIIQTSSRDAVDARFMTFLNLDGMVTRDEGVEGLAERILDQRVPQTVS